MIAQKHKRGKQERKEKRKKKDKEKRKRQLILQSQEPTRYKEIKIRAQSSQIQFQRVIEASLPRR
jgi:hypothetical protein